MLSHGPGLLRSLEIFGDLWRFDSDWTWDCTWIRTGDCNRCILDCRFIFSRICKVINGSTVPAQAKMIYFITLLDKGMLLYTTQISNHEHRGNFCRKNLYWATNVVVGYIQCTELSANCIHKQISSGSWLCSHIYSSFKSQIWVWSYIWNILSNY